MTDREMLELAAKAAGKTKARYVEIWGAMADPMEDGFDYRTHWNPLTDDGDALRLAVKLGIVVEYRREVPACFAYHYNSNLEVVQRNDQLDPHAATRRAIVRAAAEIGMQMP